MSRTIVAPPPVSAHSVRAGDLGKPLRRFTYWPAESPVPMALPSITKPAPFQEDLPAIAPLPELEPAEPVEVPA